MANLRREISGLWAQLFGLDVEAYSSLATVEDEECFVTKEGGLMSLLPVRGHRRVVGDQELGHLTQQLVTLWGSILGAGDFHGVDIVFSSDPAATAGDIGRLLAPSRRTAKRIGLDLDDLFEERIQHLPKFTCNEAIYLVVWTRPTGLPRSTRRQAHRERRRDIVRLGAPALTRDNQDPFACNHYLVDPHRSLVHTLVSELSAFGFELAVLPTVAASRALRMEADPEWTPPDWQPLLPGGPMPAPRESADGDISAAACWLPALGRQLAPRGMEMLDYRTVRVGDRLYQPFFVDLPQLTEVQRFERLLDRVRHERIPWRLLIRLSGGAESWLRARHQWSGLLNFAGHQNKLIHSAVQALRRHIHEGNVAVRVQMALTTWVNLTASPPTGRSHPEELRARSAHLAAHIQAWGGCTVRENTGHPIKAWISTLPGFSQLNIATRYAAPLADVLHTVPLFRPASLWSTGAVLYRTRDGRLFPYQPGSAEQGTWNELYFARPGSGKSVAMNANNLGLILSPGFRQLPFVRIIDIGPSSQGLISLVREALPPARAYEAQFHAPQNHEDWAINPLDTQLGMRGPIPSERAFLVSFLSVLATPPGSVNPPEGLADLAGLVIDLAFIHFSDEQAPKLYAIAQDPDVDAAVERWGIVLEDRPTWWEVVDALFAAGDPPAAIRAQRYAAPLLSDLIAIAQFPPVQHLYGEGMRLEDTAESPIQLFNRIISATTREWPMLAYPTRFDLGNARVASLDVAALCGDMTPVGQRQTAIAYMLARHVLGRDLFLDPTLASHAPPRYRTHHQIRVDRLLAYPKKFCADEKHRCGQSAAINAQFVRDMREGRKANVQVALASQILEDFSDEMAELATTIYIMEYGSDETAEAVRAKFSLSPSALALLRIYGTGPTPAGAPFLCALRTKRGLISQLLYLTTGPMELWALSTTAEDRLLRERLYSRFSPRRARAALAHAYPSGSIKAELQRRLDSADATVDRETLLATIETEIAELIGNQRLSTAAVERVA
ncbi:MAG: type IV secretion protein IcmB [Gammaproteobacteria bacterium]|nr:type IV secretion protein IcmB [Gammaproteobacteria bacterium]MCP5458738.1 type IV secretion protein IcmB [Gammaproteobacteria bacterium]MCP5460085.1 type IV secretion protein IcmB [Gammaproteobacteria bacterium]